MRANWRFCIILRILRYKTLLLITLYVIDRNLAHVGISKLLLISNINVAE